LRAGKPVLLAEWGVGLLQECAPIAAALDAAHGTSMHAEAVRAAFAAFDDPSLLPSARVLAAMKPHGDSFIGFAREQSARAREALLALPFPGELRAAFERETRDSLEEQKRIEAGDTMPFETYREQYVSPARLGFESHWLETAAAGPISQNAAL
jgi:glutamate--cysteine ligase